MYGVDTTNGNAVLLQLVKKPQNSCERYGTTPVVGSSRNNTDGRYEGTAERQLSLHPTGKFCPSLPWNGSIC